MINLGNLSPNKGSNRQRKRVGRGPGSGHGKTAGRGHKGFKSRSGSGIKPGFEGGQMPLQRRLPKRGFTNINTVQYSLISLSQLDKFEAGTEVTSASLIENGMARKGRPVKVLANGELSKAITVRVDMISGSARTKIEAAGGTVVDPKE
ncbi:MAG: 50S ribosomal protein L15 [Proteobacteria bacterium]|nr:50S ribosomal protein L15 [Pseudomonadota bacterium]MBU1232321.1 50S ribosomal protein L15 [Pseudomonadota bacterium]MBU1419383.1 50S ribosomal protein L15 [Pseudomonadota bacterium]MBU1454223.1 50S ribosomal protein L15 [Pseudomonadota bacterium]